MKMSISFYYIFFLMLAPTFLKAQQSSFIYELNYKPISDSLKTEKIVFYLDIKNKESLFRSDKFRRSDSLRVKRGTANGFDMEYNNSQLYVYKKPESNEVLKYVFVPLIYTTYTIPINEDFHWTILDEKKKIDNYNCQKAEVDYGGRKWIAWFTNEISMQEGPYVFHGLPGLIVKICDEKLNYDFELSQIRDFKWKELYPEKFQKKISWEDFQKLQKNFYNDPLAMINKSDVISYDEGGNAIKTNFKEMKENTQKRIREKNNPIELDHKVEFK
ncbi:GLPGLI family protein [Chryseobacterium sp.]|uniref:GLPGLI family protein n=1 Tax=Chryseobacterium sp. TaxID=1871047 RepID=UPI002899276D|nr:GLPGLI family protein [Chryseobacterium sp.]